MESPEALVKWADSVVSAIDAIGKAVEACSEAIDSQEAKLDDLLDRVGMVESRLDDVETAEA
jgi:intracellular sulfur oxidation DsrE/DsrF family protein